MKTLEEEKKYLQVKKSQISGKGLYTKIAIPKGEVVATYMGEIIDNDEALRRSEAGKDQFLVETVNDGYMDSMPIFCYAMYANDAMGITRLGFKNNVQIEILEGAPRLVALRNLKPGEEIFVGYGRAYWNNVKQRIKRQEKEKEAKKK